MSHRRRLLAAAAAAAVPALLAPAAADAAICTQALPGPAGWQIASDGSLAASSLVDGGSNFDTGHGTLKVNGAAYPAIPADESACTKTATSVKFPARAVGGFLVTREVTSIGGRLRWLDRVKRQAADSFKADIHFEIRVKDSQRSIESSSGDAVVTSKDDWSVHENDGGSHPFMRWGTSDSALRASVVSYGEDPNAWKPKVTSMPDARLDYPAFEIVGGQTSSVVHMSGTTSTPAESQAAAEDRTTPFTGLTKAQMAEVVNWGADADGDGVVNEDDECPAVDGNGDNGCLQFQAKPVDKTPDPQAGGGGSGGAPPALPADGPVEPAAEPLPAPVPLPRAALDTTAPRITLAKLPRRVRRALLTGRGLAPSVACDEACSVRVQVSARSRGSRRATTLLTRSTRVSGSARTIRLKLGARRISRLVRQRITVVVTATDAAGNRRSVTRTVALAS